MKRLHRLAIGATVVDTHQKGDRIFYTFANRPQNTRIYPWTSETRYNNNILKEWKILKDYTASEVDEEYEELLI